MCIRDSIAGGETISVRRSKLVPPNFPTSLASPVTDFLGDFVGDLSFFECLREADGGAPSATGGAPSPRRAGPRHVRLSGPPRGATLPQTVAVKALARRRIRSLAQLRLLHGEIAAMRDLSAAADATAAAAAARRAGGDARAQHAAAADDGQVLEGLRHVCRLFEVRLSPRHVYLILEDGGGDLHRLLLQAAAADDAEAAGGAGGARPRRAPRAAATARARARPRPR